MTLPPDFSLVTPRCELRRVSAADIPFVMDAAGHPRFCDFMTWSPPRFAEDLREPLRANEVAWADGSAYTFTIFYRDDGRRLGRIVIRREAGNAWNLGYWMHPREQGAGLMTEAAGEVLRFGFEMLGAAEVRAKHVVENGASRRVLEKIGLRFREHLPQGFEKNGVWLAEDSLGITRAEFFAAHQTP